MENNQNKPLRIAVTHGDLNGLGYEVFLKTFADARMFEYCTPVLYGSSKVASYYKKLFPHCQDMQFNVIRSAVDAVDKRINIINLTEEEVKIEMGVATAQAGELAALALDRACSDIKAKNIDALVTAPINKKNIQSDKFNFTGHTEYLSNQFGCSSLMMMVCDRVRIGILTNHLALRDVPFAITPDLLNEKIKLMNESLKRDFAITKPKIAVLAIDPHAGDGGVIGDMDATVVKPAIDRAQKEGVLAYGPFPADGFFGSSEFNNFDGVLALYHDQGLIPFKLMSFTEGVNYTAGLPIVRTSPAHGTGYDIAGKDKASEQSFRSAIYLACKLNRNRQEYDELTANPLR